MKRFPEKELDQFIEALNQERRPEPGQDPELLELTSVVRMVKSLRQPAEPTPDFGHRVHQAFRGKARSRRVFAPLAALAAGLLLVLVFQAWSSFFNQDLVLAMEQAVARLNNYHGIIEMRTTNQAGEEWVVRQVEVWAEGNKYATRQDNGTLTVNNGEQRWQVRPDNQTVVVLPVVPDPQRHGFDFNLKTEAERARQYPHTVVGETVVAARPAIQLEISPPGGLPYQLWIDQETKLPLQLKTAMINALQTTYTFISFESNVSFEPTLFTFQVPAGYQVIEKDPGQLVNTPGEASVIAGFAPLVPSQPPVQILAHKDKVVFNYGDTTIVETPAAEPFKPAAHGAVGQAGGGPLEVLSEQLRWQQEGIEITIEGPDRVELARQLASDLSLPAAENDLASQAAVKVYVDLEIAKADQQQVDAGHSPWQLDPSQVALTFVYLQISPEGIQGEPPEIGPTSIIKNTGVEAIVGLKAGPIKQVYLKRLVRPDETGIWSVVGYDPR